MFLLIIQSSLVSLSTGNCYSARYTGHKTLKMYKKTRIVGTLGMRGRISNFGMYLVDQIIKVFVTYLGTNFIWSDMKCLSKRILILQKTNLGVLIFLFSRLVYKQLWNSFVFIMASGIFYDNHWYIFKSDKNKRQRTCKYILSW